MIMDIMDIMDIMINEEEEQKDSIIQEYLIDDNVERNVDLFFGNPTIAKYANSKEELFVQFHTKILERISRRYDWLDIAPSGFYGIPLNREALKKAMMEHGRRVAKPRITVFGIQGNVLRTSKYEMADLERDIAKLLVKYPDARAEVMRWREDLPASFEYLKHNPHKKGKYFLFLRNLNQYLINDLRSLDKLYLNLGYDAIYDDAGYALIEDFPMQIAVLNTQAVAPKLAIENPIFVSRVGEIQS